MWDLEATTMSSGKPSEGLGQGMTQFQFTFCKDVFGGCGQNGQVWKQGSQLGAVQSPEVMDAWMRQVSENGDGRTDRTPSEGRAYGNPSSATPGSRPFQYSLIQSFSKR